MRKLGFQGGGLGHPTLIGEESRSRVTNKDFGSQEGWIERSHIDWSGEPVTCS